MSDIEGAPVPAPNGTLPGEPLRRRGRWGTVLLWGAALVAWGFAAYTIWLPASAQVRSADAVFEAPPRAVLAQTDAIIADEYPAYAVVSRHSAPEFNRFATEATGVEYELRNKAHPGVTVLVALFKRSTMAKEDIEGLEEVRPGWMTNDSLFSRTGKTARMAGGKAIAQLLVDYPKLKIAKTQIVTETTSLGVDSGEFADSVMLWFCPSGRSADYDDLDSYAGSYSLVWDPVKGHWDIDGGVQYQ